MANYYFLAASLPELQIGEKPDIDFSEFSHRLEDNLNETDMEQTVVLRRYLDIINLRALFLGKPLDWRGNLNESELDEVVLHSQGMPEYILDFLEKHESLEARIKNFSQVIATYFVTEIQNAQGFLRDYLKFEREIRLVLLGFRSKMMGRDLVKELQYEDFSDPLVAYLLLQKDSDVFEPPSEYHELKELFYPSQLNPLQRYQKFLTFKFQRIEEMVENPLFSIDYILSFIVKFLLVEWSNELDHDKGNVVLDNLSAIGF